MQKSKDVSGFRLPDEILKSMRDGNDPNQIYKALDKYDYWFAKQQDSDVYEWFAKTGCYSPIVHLQQTDGTYSGHKPFTKEYNETGIIYPKEVFKAIKKSYDLDAEQGMPEKVDDIYLAYELFFGVGDSKESIIAQLRETVEYWRKYMPRDGMRLDELV